jgi:predicted acylesterase/phospholipase RssA
MEKETVTEKSAPIKHLVLSGGGAVGFIAYSILREANKSGIWNIDDIESIYGTSAGAIIGVFIALNYDWDEIDNYMIKRPWENVFKFDVGAVLRSFDSKGILGKKIIEEIICPLLRGKDLEPTITMQELYEYSKIDIHIFSTEIHKYETVDISHKTHPNWRVIDAVYCSACLPIMFMPYLNDGGCYADGGIIINYPIYACLESGANPDEVLGITFPKQQETIQTITEETSLFDYLFFILNKMREHSYLYAIKNKDYTIKYEIEVDNAIDIVYDFVNVLSSQLKRSLLLDKGVEIWKKYMEENITNCEHSPDADKPTSNMG